MRIKSSYRDFYDHIAYIYGGGDPKVVYIRRKFPAVTETDEITGTIAVDHTNVRELPRVDPFRSTHRFKWLVIAGKYYLLASKYNEENYTLLDEVEHAELIKKEFTSRPWRESKTYANYVGSDGGEGLLELSRKLDAPVFVINDTYHYNWPARTYDIRVDRNIPILGDLGVAKLIPPEQMYQNIAYFLANTMHVSPDLAPPVDIADKDRIVQAGFDLKQSFRHRKD
jgi:hypothetical protein